MMALVAVSALLLCGPARAADDNQLPTVLFIGDSHSATEFGWTLDKKLRESKQWRVATFAVAGSRSDSWFSGESHGGCFFRDIDGKSPTEDFVNSYTPDIPDCYQHEIETPSFSALIKYYRPSAVIVALGSNDAQFLSSKYHAIASSVQNMLDLIHAQKAQCFWVGPPWMRSVSDAAVATVYNDVLASHHVDSSHDPQGSDGCRLIDSRYLHYPSKGGDGIHYTAGVRWLAPGTSQLHRLGIKWGNDVYNAFANAVGISNQSLQASSFTPKPGQTLVPSSVAGGGRSQGFDGGN